MKKLFFALGIIIFFSFSIFSQSSETMNPEAAKYFNSGNDLMKQGNYNGAIVEYDKGLKIVNDYRILYQKGIALKKMGKTEESINVFSQCITQNPNFDLTYNARGGSYFALNNMEAAINDFEKVIQISKNAKLKSSVKEYISRSYAKMGNSELSNGSYNKAIDYFNKAVESFNYDAAYLGLARAYNDLSDWDKAIAAAQNAVKYKDSISRGAGYYYLGLAYKGKGDLTKAKENFNLAVSDPSYKKLVEYELSLLK
ncbi:MAG: hypothetical protein STSR0008_03890 [Ignavibacterium sp.]